MDTNQEKFLPTNEEEEKIVRSKRKKQNELSEFQKYFLEAIKPKINIFVKQHLDHILTSTLVEILYVDIFTTFARKAIIDEAKFSSYTHHQKIEKIRQVKKLVERQNFIFKLMGLKGEQAVEVCDEKYFDDGPSLFNKDMKDLVMFECFAKQNNASFNLDEIFTYEVSLIFKKLGYKDLSMEVINLIERKKLYEIQHKRQDYEMQKEEVKNSFEEVPGISVIEPPTSTPSSQSYQREKLISKKE